MRGIPLKERRAVRRRNHVAYDLAKPKYRQRKVERKRFTPDFDEDNYDGD